MTTSRLLSFVFLFALPAAGFATGPAGLCKKVFWKEGRVYSFRSALHQYTHIVLPQRLLGTPMPGNKDLWETTGGGRHVYIKPTHLAKEASKTTLSLVDRANRSYEFLITRVRRVGDPCVLVKLDNDSPLDPAISNWRTPEEATIDDYRSLVDRIGTNGTPSVEEALNQYRSHIYTGYSWTTKESGFAGNRFIQDVYDDGRFTLIRVSQDNKGLFSVHAEIDGEEQVIQKTYDPKYHLYKISGIFPKFILQSGDSKIVVSRTDNSTTGGY